MKKSVSSLVLLLALTLSTWPAYGQQKVKASFYAHKFHGRKTASGQPYHKDSLTCAHKTLPFGTMLKVRNPKNNKEVVVKVTDRGPFIKGRTLDLSYAAAKALNMIHHGVITVEFWRHTNENPSPLLLSERIETPPHLKNIKKMTAPNHFALLPYNTFTASDSFKQPIGSR